MIQRIVNPLVAGIIEDIISRFDGAEVEDSDFRGTLGPDRYG